MMKAGKCKKDAIKIYCMKTCKMCGGKCKDKMPFKKCKKILKAGKCEDKKNAEKCMKTCNMCD